MSMRWRIFLAAVVLIVLPMMGLSWILRHRLADQSSREFARQAAGQLAGATASLHDRGRRIVVSLRGIASALQDDNQFRLAVVGGRDDLLPYLRDTAGRAMNLSGLQVLQLLDGSGVILSSGHYRNEFGRRDAGLVPLLRQAVWLHAAAHTDEVAAAADMALVSVRMPDGDVLALLVAHPMRLGGITLHLVGGEILDSSSLAALSSNQARLALAASTGLLLDDPWFADHLAGFSAWFDPDRMERAMAGAGYLVRSESVPLVLGGSAADPSADSGRLSEARLIARVSTLSLQAALRELNATLGLALAAALAGAFGLAAWLSARLSRPLQDLAEKAARVDLDNPSVELSVQRGDEVGRLARILAAMVARLREDARRLAAAEHRATLGEIARQVNHDLRNGLTPVRNVLRHLNETADTAPEELAEVFGQRLPTLDSSLAYLEELAGRYARLAPQVNVAPCDVGAVAAEAVQGLPQVEVRASADAPLVMADPVSIRRILDNLLRNAHEALRPEGGRITVTVERVEDDAQGSRCRLSVSDDGVGMTAEVAQRCCEDFFTTRSGGTGLGLSNVRRLVGDMGGSLAIDSAPGDGTAVRITIDAAEHNA